MRWLDAAARRKAGIGLALCALYLIWGSTYLAMLFAIESLPPLMMAALRFGIAGALLYVLLRLRGVAAPTRQQWGGAATVGVLLLSIGNASVAVAQQTVASGIAATVVATVPLWVAIFSWFWHEPPTRREWLGIGFGLLGVAALATAGSLQASPKHALLLLLAAMSWAFGSIWGKRLPMPPGAMASAAQMLVGGGVLVAASALAGEPWPATIGAKSLWAMVYLILFGSMVTYSAYLYLLKTVRPALATSNTFVNPVVAMLLGIWLAHETIELAEVAALVAIIVGVLLVMPFRRKSET